jgi:hypothetical protein
MGCCCQPTVPPAASRIATARIPARTNPPTSFFIPFPPRPMDHHLFFHHPCPATHVPPRTPIPTPQPPQHLPSPHPPPRSHHQSPTAQPHPPPITHPHTQNHCFHPICFRVRDFSAANMAPPFNLTTARGPRGGSCATCTQAFIKTWFLNMCFPTNTSEPRQDHTLYIVSHLSSTKCVVCVCSVLLSSENVEDQDITKNLRNVAWQYVKSVNIVFYMFQIAFFKIGQPFSDLFGCC